MRLDRVELRRDLCIIVHRNWFSRFRGGQIGSFNDE